MNEPVEIVPYDDRWPDRAQELISSLTELLAPRLTAGIHHVGSTAVPGLAAKPIIDLLAGVDGLDLEEATHRELEEDGWHYVPPDLDDRPWRRLFVKVKAEKRYAHLHLVHPSNERWDNELGFRDRLRADPDLAIAYAQLKRKLAAEYHDDREAYTRGKTDFIRSALAKPTELGGTSEEFQGQIVRVPDSGSSIEPPTVDTDEA